MVEGQARRRCAGWARGRALPATLLAALLCLGLAAPLRADDEWRPASDPCAAWPGEPEPLPRASDPDPLRARWASLRVRELAAQALADEPTAPLRANRLWRRVLCLDPASDAAAAGLARTPLVAVHHPPLVTRGEDERSADAWSDLDRPLAVGWRSAPRSSSAVRAVPVEAGGALAPDPEATADAQPVAAMAPPPDPVGVLLEEVQEHLHAARYAEALARAERGRGELPADTSPARAAELEVLSATAALALDRKDEAAASLRRALAAQPMLTLDPMQTPPKVRRAFDRVRAGAEP